MRLACIPTPVLRPGQGCAYPLEGGGEGDDLADPSPPQMPNRPPRDVLEGGDGRGGGLAGTPPPATIGGTFGGPPMVPAEGGPKILKLQSSWHRSKISAVSLKHWKGRRGGSPPSSCGVRPF